MEILGQQIDSSKLIISAEDVNKISDRVDRKFKKLFKPDFDKLRNWHCDV